MAALQLCVDFNNLPAVKWLLANGAAPNTTSTGGTAVFNAVTEDNLEMVTLLVNSGANINAQDCDGWTPLCRTNSLTMAQLLLKLGADPNIRDQASMLCWDWVGDPRNQSIPQEIFHKIINKTHVDHLDITHSPTHPWRPRGRMRTRL